jgi:hypothetical protein
MILYCGRSVLFMFVPTGDGRFWVIYHRSPPGVSALVLRCQTLIGTSHQGLVDGPLDAGTLLLTAVSNTISSADMMQNISRNYDSKISEQSAVVNQRLKAFPVIELVFNAGTAEQRPLSFWDVPLSNPSMHHSMVHHEQASMDSGYPLHFVSLRHQLQTLKRFNCFEDFSSRSTIPVGLPHPPTTFPHTPAC